MSLGSNPSTTPAGPPFREPTVEWYHRLVERLETQEQAFRQMYESFLKFRVWVTTIFGIAGTIIGISAWGIISAAWSLQGEMGSMKATMAHQTASIEKLDKRFDDLRALGDKLDRVAEGLARVEGRLDRDASPAPKSKQ
jgi:hypothetical protein